MMRILKTGLLSLVIVIFLCGTSLRPVFAQDDPSPKTQFNWVSWLNAGERVWKMVLRVEPNMKDMIGTGETVSVAVEDLDYDGQNDVILYFWGADECGADGCLYVVLTYDGKTKRGYMAHHFERSGKGVKVDGRYFPLYGQ